MPHFLIKSSDIENNIIHVKDGETLRHLVSALRIKTREVVKFIDENKINYKAEIINVSKKEVLAKIINSEPSTRELPYNIYLAQSILKTDGENLLISNASQLGIKGVYPFISEHCAVKNYVAKLKAEKLQKIADEAFKQCERADLMQVYEIMPLSKILEKFKKENIIIFAEKYENTDILDAIKDINKNDDILVVTGPEGGFSEKEFEYFKTKGFKMATLGNLIFKAPNAVTAGVSNVIFALNLKAEDKLR